MKNMLTPLLKIYFYLVRPKAVFIFSKESQVAVPVFYKMLNYYFKLWRKVFVFELSAIDARETEFFVSHSSKPLLVLLDFDEESIKYIKKIIKLFDMQKIILNNDAEGTPALKEEIHFYGLTFGLKQNADFQASDIKENGGVNFKLNREGSSVPVWLQNSSGKPMIFAALAALASGTIFGLNLVEISHALKSNDRCNKKHVASS